MEPILYAAAAVLAITASINAAARRLDLPSPVLLVIAGIVLAIIPGLPRIELPPNLVLLVFLPPIIYYAAFRMSWQAFCKNLRPIVLLAVGCVVFTTVTVAAAAHWLIGLTWPVAFILGAIVSPPDVVAPLAIARRLGVPDRISAVLEGEGLVNDATALVLFNFALAAALTGTFSIGQATMTFVTIVVTETLFGLAVGWVMLRLRHLARDPRIEVTLSLLTPFLAFWVPHAAGGSGVLATVVAGLYVGAKGVELIRANTRLQALFFWDFVTYLIEGAIFLLTGLQARTILDGLQGMSWSQLLFYGLAISLVAIIVRFVWVFPATYLPRRLSPRLRQREPDPPWQYPFLIAFTGVRGVVSLAVALSIPVFIAPGQPLAERDLVLFLTFSVILVTLVLQGPTLPSLVKRLGLVQHGSQERLERERLEAQTRIDAVRAALRSLHQGIQQGSVAPDDVRRLREWHEDRISRLEHRDRQGGGGGKVVEQTEAIELVLIQAQRDYINGLLREDRIGDDIRRRIERDLDLREEELRRNVRGAVVDGD